MKVLCVCQEGNSRSVVLASILKNELAYDALAMGIRKTSEPTKEMLYEWADMIVLVDKTFVPEIPTKYLNKLAVWDVGQDRYFQGFSQDLIDQYHNYIARWKAGL